MDHYLLNSDECSIIACCTPSGNGAIALLRISGNDALCIATKMSRLPRGKTIEMVDSHTVQYGWVVDAQANIIDQVLFLVMHGPNTFTGQNTVEITCHNNPFIIQNIIDRAIAVGARLAQEGEFTKRAVINDKMDLLQAEAINELIRANTQMSLKQSLAQLDGSFSHWIDRLQKNLVKALAFCEASFEFIDEQMTFDQQIIAIIDDTLTTIQSIKKSFDAQQQIRNGFRIALIGSVNAGKSSLFNALLNKKRAIVTSIAGTTRDVIEAGLYKNGNYWTLIDTAGLRETNDVIEQEGIKRSFHEADASDLVLLVYDASRLLTEQEKVVYDELTRKQKHKIIVVHNKIDVAICQSQDGLGVSAQDGIGILQLESVIQCKIEALCGQAESPFLLNQRQFNLLVGLEQKLVALRGMMRGTLHYELISYHLNDALSDLSELTGKSISEAGMDAVFREFCVGK